MQSQNQKPAYPQINVTEVIRSKNPRLVKALPRFLLRKVEKILHQDKVNYFLRENADADGYQFVAAGIKMFGAKIHINGQENLPAGKRLLFVANHPLGGLDGLVFVHVVHQMLGEIRFPVNDLLLNIPNFKEIFLPVNKHGSHNREAFKAIDEAYMGNAQILYFPAGMCSRKIKGKIMDLDWRPSFISQAVKYQRDVVPVYIEGKNSKFFYNLANFRKRLGIKANIEMFFLVDEMYNQYNRDIAISFGEPIAWQTFDKSKSNQHWANMVRQKVYKMQKP